jgi:DNA polymerase-1
MPNKAIILLFDANAFVHKAYYAIKNDLKTQNGIPTNGLYGFFMMVLTLIKDIKPTYCAFAFDVSKKTFRNDIYEAYKATRIKAPDALYEQMNFIKEGLNKLGAKCFGEIGFEADDLLGTMAEKSRNQNLTTIIATGDADAIQLVKKDDVIVASISKGITNLEFFNEEEVFKKFNFLPQQIIDYKALCGDPSDNIRGVKGIGKIGAIKLLNEFKTIENIYLNIDKITEKMKNLLICDKESAFLSKRLATINTEVNINFDLLETQIDKWNIPALLKFFEKYECFNLIKKCDFFNKTKEIIKEKQMTLF